MSDGPLEPVAVYGTLGPGQRNHRLLAGATSLGTGFVSGQLHDIPSAAVPDKGFQLLPR